MLDERPPPGVGRLPAAALFPVTLQRVAVGRWPDIRRGTGFAIDPRACLGIGLPTAADPFQDCPMKRRDFLKSLTAAGAASVVSAPAVWSPARAQSRQETLLVVTEYGPNNFDIHGVGTNRPGYEV